MKQYQIFCTSCGREEKRSITKCSRCYGSLETRIKQKIKIGLNTKDNVFTKYNCFFPLSNRKILRTYPNSPTPIVEIKDGVFAKLDYCSFSGSSKDREAFIEIAMAKKLGYRGIVVATTGNMGVALASQCALTNYPCLVLAPLDTSTTKIRQIERYGSKIKLYRKHYNDIVPYAEKISRENHWFLASLQAFRFEGYKSISYEIYDFFGKKLPKNIIIPIGDGTTFVAVWKGFVDLKRAGLINDLPTFIGVQAKGCDPVSRSYKQNRPINRIINPKTIAKAIMVTSPLDGNYSVKVARLTGGKIFSYSDAKILACFENLARFGIEAEYASAATYCPTIYENINDCLLLITGSGLKN
ncbi:MAG: Putative threonine synthase (TS) (Modular protein) [Microgenomates bacterium 39_6]|nr:MAG: Putative threonine synthase (TS) (Modular protein) [Microgenomates bacterium 39_6]